MLSMELQLGLPLPVHHCTSSPNMVKGLDLNDQYSLEYPNEVSLASSYGWECNSHGGTNSKRSFEDAFGIFNKKGSDDDHDNNIKSNKTGLLVWDGNEEDDQKEHKKRDTDSINQLSDGESYVVGWPPIKSSRKKELLLRQYGHIGRQIMKNNRPSTVRTATLKKISNTNKASSNNYCNESVYVKVKMEGVAIARKIDLSLHNSYQALKNNLITMFTDYDKKFTEDNIGGYTLAYQDKDGDWLLAGDVPWKSFIKSVQRLEIVKHGVVNSL
ncbi:auxin-responsive protein IAA29 isoform X2 [Humulus lupulus]|uniref:auxin-responsive protein IAA29 isoform X2 n=1 Tax=Humulus lupulus TaxID=3486 RepID=UPI002B403150|nr:auxin-responsive protein IAA29 isoform X2 [Humulus lupulus]